MLELQKISAKQKEHIKELQKDVESFAYEVENLQNNVEKLIRQNKELLRKNNSLQKQGKTLLLERSDLLRRCKKADEDNLRLRKIINETSINEPTETKVIFA